MAEIKPEEVSRLQAYLQDKFKNTGFALKMREKSGLVRPIGGTLCHDWHCVCRLAEREDICWRGAQLRSNDSCEGHQQPFHSSLPCVHRNPLLASRIDLPDQSPRPAARNA